MVVPLRADVGAARFRAAARKSKDAPQARRLLALAAVRGAGSGRKPPGSAAWRCGSCGDAVLGGARDDAAVPAAVGAAEAATAALCVCGPTRRRTGVDASLIGALTAMRAGEMLNWHTLQEYLDTLISTVGCGPSGRPADRGAYSKRNLSKPQQETNR